jgi:integrase/recombinase XerC
MRLSDAVALFVVQLEADGRSVSTRDQYARHVSLLARWLAQEEMGNDLDQITHEDLARFLADPRTRTSQRGGPKRPTSMNALRSSLRSFFTYTHSAGWSSENPARLIRRARCGTPPPRGLSDQDRERLLDALTVAQGEEARRDHMLINLMLSTGIRLSSALALRACDVDLDRGDVVLWNAKGARVERIVLGTAIMDHMIGFMAGREAGPLFAGKDGRPISRRHAVRRLDVWMRRAKCKGIANPHMLRHDFAQRLYLATGDLLLVQRGLGHRSIASTLVYARADSERLRAALSRRVSGQAIPRDT